MLMLKFSVGNALQAAAAAGHVDIINLLLEHKPPAVVSAPGGRYGSALMAAICSGSSDTVFALLEEKANPNLRSKVHGKPLEKAADMGHSGKEIVKDLLEFKAEADLSPKREDFHILHKAAMYGMQELGSYCLENGCDIGMKTTKGPSYHRRFGDFAQEMTPLAYASAEGNLGMVRLLLNRGASLERGKDPSGVLWIAAYQGHADVVDILIKTFKQNHSSEATARFIDQRPTRRSGHPILWAACSSSSPETVRVLLDHGAKYESNWYKVTPLLATATFARPNVAKTLLEYHRRGKIDVCLNQRANNGRTALYEACENNRQRILEQLLDAGADYTIRDDHDCTPLHAGTHHDAIGVLTLLYKKAHEEMDEDALEDFMNARSKGGQTALIQAVDRNKLPHASFLLDCGADYTIAGHLGNTPLHFACRHGNEQMYKKLIERAKMDDEHQSFQEFLDLRNKDGCTALHRATNEQRVSIVQLLLRHGADFTIANNRDVTPLHGATWRGFKDIMVLILEQAIRQLDVAQFRAFINRRNYAGTTALVDSAKPLRKQFRMDVTTTLLEYGADPTIPRNHEITALHHACFDGRLDLVQLLLDHAQQKFTPTRISAFLNHRNYLGRTALYDAIRSARDNPEIEILQMLLDRGADYAIPNKDGVTTLHAAAFHGNVAVVRMLLSHSSDKDPERFSTYVNARNKSGKTALHDSCDKGRPKVTKLLMDHGIDFTIEDTQGRTALHWCIPRDQIKTMQVLLDEASARETADNGHPSQRFQNFINAARTDGAMTALHDVSVRGDVEMARVLLEHGADFECYDATAQTPLHGGISHGHEAMAILLLEHASRGPGPVEQQKLWRFLKPGSTSALKVTTAKEAAAEKGMGKVVSMIEELERKCEAR